MDARTLALKLPRRNCDVMDCTGVVHSVLPLNNTAWFPCRARSPIGGWRLLLGHFFNPAPCAFTDIGGEVLQVEKLRFPDFHSRHKRANLKLSYYIEYYMIAAKIPFIGIKAEQFRLALERDRRLFFKLARQRSCSRFSALKTPAGKGPARQVTGSDEKNPALIVGDHGANSNGHASGQAEPAAHDGTHDQGIKASSKHAAI